MAQAELMLPATSYRLAAAVALQDGRWVRLRRVTPADAPLLREFHARLSPESRYLRFFEPKPYLAEWEARYLANVDFRDRFAITAAVDEEVCEHLVADARIHRLDRSSAEVAIVVRDDYQRVGLARLMLTELARLARAAGIRSLHAEALAENRAVLHILRTAGALPPRPRDGIVRAELALIPSKPNNGKEKRWTRE